MTGTGTNVGKTYVTRLLLEALGRDRRSACGFKPISCGDRLDAQILLEGAQPHPPDGGIDAINPVHLKTPAAPYAACLIENRTIDFDAIDTAFNSLCAEYDHVLVEGAGGWEVPLTDTETFADFAARLGLQVIVVIDNRLGALNHTILTVRAIEARGLTCAGLILNYVDDERDSASISNRAVLEQFLPNVPVLGDVLHGAEDFFF
ncbi:MAG: dethiobiotin synthase [Verrucomicrobiota bacterium]